MLAIERNPRRVILGAELAFHWRGDLSQSALARKMGCKPDTIFRWETGNNSMRPKEILKLSAACNVDPNTVARVHLFDTVYNSFLHDGYEASYPIAAALAGGGNQNNLFIDLLKGLKRNLGASIFNGEYGKSTVSRWFSGKRFPPTETLKNLRDLLVDYRYKSQEEVDASLILEVAKASYIGGICQSFNLREIIRIPQGLRACAGPGMDAQTAASIHNARSRLQDQGRLTGVLIGKRMLAFGETFDETSAALGISSDDLRGLVTQGAPSFVQMIFRAPELLKKVSRHFGYGEAAMLANLSQEIVMEYLARSGENPKYVSKEGNGYNIITEKGLAEVITIDESTSIRGIGLSPKEFKALKNHGDRYELILVFNPIWPTIFRIPNPASVLAASSRFGRFTPNIGIGRILDLQAVEEGSIVSCSVREHLSQPPTGSLPKVLYLT